MSNKCTHETSVVKRMCTGFDVVRCTWECGEDLIELRVGNHRVATLTAEDVVKLREDLKQVEANYDALMSPMLCGHLARYAVQTNNTQYCAVCEAEKMTDTVLGMKAA